MKRLAVALRLASIEFLRGGVMFWRPAPAGRDFGALTVLCAVLIGLTTLATSSGSALQRNLIQGMLGHVEGAGTPIWLLVHSSRLFLGPEQLAAFRNGGGFTATHRPRDPNGPLAQLDFHPVVEVEPLDPYVRLPCATAGPESPCGAAIVWRERMGPGDPPMELRGWGIDRANPLWIASGGPASGRTLVANAATFRKRFDYAAYRTGLAGVAPAPLLEALPERIDDVTDLHRLILSVRLHGNLRRLQLFDVTWVESLPGLQKVSLLVPLDGIAPAKLVYENENLTNLGPEDVDDEGTPGAVLRRITVYGATRAEVRRRLEADGRDALAEVAACLGRRSFGSNGPYRWSERGTDRVLEIDGEVTWAVAKACLARSGLAPDAGFDAVRPGFDLVDAPLAVAGRTATARCAAVRPSLLAQDTRGLCAEGGAEATFTFSAFPDFRTGIVFVPDRLDLAEAIDAVTGQTLGGEPVVISSESYRDALGRISYARAVIAHLGSALALFGLLLVGVILLLQIAPTIERRRKSYGLLLARGMSRWEVTAGILLQMGLAVILGAVVAAVSTELTKAAFEGWFAGSQAARLAQSELGLLHPRLIPDVSLIGRLAHLGGATGLVLAAAIVAALWTIRRLPLRRSTAPIDLMVTQARVAEEAS